MANVDGGAPENEGWPLEEVFVVWNKLVDIWITEDWQQKSAVGASNCQAPKQGCGKVKHSCGSIPVELHKDRMTKSLKRHVAQVEAYKKTHTKKGINSYVDKRSELVVESYNSCLSQKFGEEVTSQPSFEDKESWLYATGGIKKGRALGYGNKVKAKKVFQSACSASSSCDTYPSSQRTSSHMQWTDEMEQMFNQRVNERVEEAVQHRVEQEVQQRVIEIERRMELAMDQRMRNMFSDMLRNFGVAPP